MQRATSLAGLSLLAALYPAAVAGGAWTRAEGTGQFIVASGRSIAPVGAFAGGAAESDKSFMQIYAEYGLRDGLTIGGTIYGDFSTTSLTEGVLSGGALVRQRLYRDDAGNVVSVEVSGSLPAERWISGDFARSKPDSTPEAGARALYGASWWGDWGSAFLSTAAGWTWRSEGAADEYRGELSAGYQPRRCCLLLLSANAATPPAGGGEDSLKISPSIAYTDHPVRPRNARKPEGRPLAMTVQFGLSYDLLDPDAGLGFQVSYWYPF